MLILTRRQFNAPRALADKTFIPQTTINWIVNNADLTTEYYALELVDYTLPYTSYSQSELPLADVTLTMDRSVLDEISTSANMTDAFNQAVAGGMVKVQGDCTRVTDIFDLLDIFPADFNIVTPPKPEKPLPPTDVTDEALHSMEELQLHYVGSGFVAA